MRTAIQNIPRWHQISEIAAGSKLLRTYRVARMEHSLVVWGVQSLSIRGPKRVLKDQPLSILARDHSQGQVGPQYRQDAAQVWKERVWLLAGHIRDPRRIRWLLQSLLETTTARPQAKSLDRQTCKSFSRSRHLHRRWYQRGERWRAIDHLAVHFKSPFDQWAQIRSQNLRLRDKCRTFAHLRL